jgi:hypothetical protein
MKLTIESTSELVLINDQPARVWRGQVNGVECRVYVAAIECNASDGELFELDLVERVQPMIARRD